ncbi:MAG: hypothetical protein ABMA14_05535 [Hyphomonadaceae bacterium]
MKSMLGALIGAAFLLAAGAASGQQVTIGDHVADLVKQRAKPTEKMVGDVGIAELGESEISEFVFRIDPGKTYYVRGACDDDCPDIDLQAFNAAGDSVGEDAQPNELPEIQIPAGKSGAELHVIISVETCLQETCVSGVGLFQTEP